jgi:hypothetical protein
MSWNFDVKGEIASQPMAPVMCCSDPDAQMQAMATGVGAALRRDSHRTAGAPAHAHISERIGLYIYYPQRINVPGGGREFIAVDWLKDSHESRGGDGQTEHCCAAGAGG